MARIAQAFTTTRKTVTLTHDQLQEIPDIEQNGSTFTDGVGTISPKLAQKVEEALCGTMSISKRKNVNRSSCYQIRLGGYKGMLSVDSVLDGEVVRLRPSMDKFDARDSLTLDIASSFRTPLAAFLNRPLIKLLEDLRIPAKVFLHLQTRTVTNIEQSRLSMDQSAKLMTTHGLGVNSGLPQILRRLAGLMKTDNPELLQSRFLEDCLDLVVIDCLRDLKYRARIPLLDSYTLVGVADEDKCLSEGEIYACIKPKDKSKKYLKGPIAITRSPCIHPGDVQVVTAIGRPPPGCQRLEGLTNCVVFSVKGKRSLPSCLGGGDLDGDLYNVITSPELIPSTSNIYSPASYPPPQMKSLYKPCEIEDGIRFFLDYISSDLVGAIATRHLLVADRSAIGSKDPECLKLASLHSKAVDYPKTGMPVSITELPKFDGARPDFMCPEYVLSRQIQHNEQYYESQNTLGQLFRAIPAERTEFFDSGPLKGILPTSVPGKSSRQQLKRLGPLDPDRKITRALQAALRQYGQQDSIDPIWRDEFVTLLRSFSDELYKICKQNTLKKSIGFSEQHLSEMEAFVGMILSSSSDRRLKRESLSRLIEQTSELFDMLKSEILGEVEDIYHHDDENEGFDQQKQRRKSLDEISLISLSSGFEPNETLISRSLAGWIVAIEETNKTFGVHSFGFVCLRILCSELRL
ncbi:hypothetical protein O181_059083 [Austropuccinia psidii MF-1]|uniref:RNA-dependent RNA polymerase n=1 Tax=Austropuccinia psidii MF-1 TaxID=1389203 RepID=A0A9Q3HW69_9BASI|nr:hypothetical protein [Austropuccinia psidii MF-1]